jgi:chloride channel 7
MVCFVHGKDISITNAGMIKFGEYDSNPYKLQDFPFFVILGIFGGLLGAFFIFFNAEMNAIRKKKLDTKFKKIVECCALTALTATVLFLAP